MKDEELMKMMVHDANLAMVDGPRFGAGGEQYLRMNIALPRLMLEKALYQMRDAIRGKFPEKF